MVDAVDCSLVRRGRSGRAAKPAPRADKSTRRYQKLEALELPCGRPWRRLLSLISPLGPAGHEWLISGWRAFASLCCDDLAVTGAAARGDPCDCFADVTANLQPEPSLTPTRRAEPCGPRQFAANAGSNRWFGPRVHQLCPRRPRLRRRR
jgi:hypothetical protein